MAEESSDFVSDSLGASEDQDLVGAVFHDLFHVLDHAISLLEFRDNLHNLGDAMVSRQIHGANIGLDVVVEVVRCKLSNFFWPSCRPHESLSVGSDLAYDLADLRLETHVKHTVSLVENQIGHTTQVGLSGLEHVDETSRSSDADFHTTREITNLAAFRNTAVDTSVPNARGFAEFSDLLLDLDSKFSGRGKDEDDGTITRRQKGLSINVHDGRKAISQSFARTGLGDSNHITSRQSHGPSLTLNSGWACEALGLDLGHDIARERCLVEGLDRSWNVAALD